MLPSAARGNTKPVFHATTGGNATKIGVRKINVAPNIKLESTELFNKNKDTKLLPMPATVKPKNAQNVIPTPVKRAPVISGVEELAAINKSLSIKAACHAAHEGNNGLTLADIMQIAVAEDYSKEMPADLLEYMNSMNGRTSKKTRNKPASVSTVLSAQPEEIPVQTRDAEIPTQQLAQNVTYDVMAFVAYAGVDPATTDPHASTADNYSETSSQRAINDDIIVAVDDNDDEASSISETTVVLARPRHLFQPTPHFTVEAARKNPQGIPNYDVTRGTLFDLETRFPDPKQRAVRASSTFTVDLVDLMHERTVSEMFQILIQETRRITIATAFSIFLLLALIIFLVCGHLGDLVFSLLSKLVISPLIILLVVIINIRRYRKFRKKKPKFLNLRTALADRENKIRASRSMTWGTKVRRWVVSDPETPFDRETDDITAAKSVAEIEGDVLAGLGPDVTEDADVIRKKCPDFCPLTNSFFMRHLYDKETRRVNQIGYQGPMENFKQNSVLVRFANSMSSTRPFVIGTLAGTKTIPILIDTGAGVNCINQQMVLELEDALGYTLCRVDGTTRIRAMGGFMLPSFGMVMIKVQLGNTILDLPFTVVPTSTSPCIIGSSLLTCGLFLDEHPGTNKLYVRGRSNKHVCDVIMHAGRQPLRLVSELESLMPGASVFAKCDFVAAQGHRHDLRGIDGLVTENPDCPFKLSVEQVSAPDKKGRISVRITSNEVCEISLAEETRVANYERMDMLQHVSFSPFLFLAQHDSQVLSKCVCKEPNKIIICSRYGISGLGIKYDATMGLPDYDYSLGNSLIYSHDHHSIYVVPHEFRDFDDFDCTGLRTLMLKHNLSPSAEYSVIYSDPAMLNTSFRNMYARLAQDFKFKLRLSVYHPEADICRICKEQNIDGMVVPFGHVVKNINLFLAANYIAAPEPLRMRDAAIPMQRLELTGASCDFLYSDKVLNIHVHISELLHMYHLDPQLRKTLLQLLVPLRNKYPAARLHIFTSAYPDIEQNTANTMKSDRMYAAVCGVMNKLKRIQGSLVFPNSHARTGNIINKNPVYERIARDNCSCRYCAAFAAGYHDALSEEVRLGATKIIYSGQWEYEALSDTELANYLDKKEEIIVSSPDDVHICEIYARQQTPKENNKNVTQFQSMTPRATHFNIELPDVMRNSALTNETLRRIDFLCLGPAEENPRPRLINSRNAKVFYENFDPVFCNQTDDSDLLLSAGASTRVKRQETPILTPKSHASNSDKNVIRDYANTYSHELPQANKEQSTLAVLTPDLPAQSPRPNPINPPTINNPSLTELINDKDLDYTLIENPIIPDEEARMKISEIIDLAGHPGTAKPGNLKMHVNTYRPRKYDDQFDIAYIPIPPITAPKTLSPKKIHDPISNANKYKDNAARFGHYAATLMGEPLADLTELEIDYVINKHIAESPLSGPECGDTPACSDSAASDNSSERGDEVRRSTFHDAEIREFAETHAKLILNEDGMEIHSAEIITTLAPPLIPLEALSLLQHSQFAPPDPTNLDADYSLPAANVDSAEPDSPKVDTHTASTLTGPSVATTTCGDSCRHSCSSRFARFSDDSSQVESIVFSASGIAVHDTLQVQTGLLSAARTKKRKQPPLAPRVVHSKTRRQHWEPDKDGIAPTILKRGAPAPPRPARPSPSASAFSEKYLDEVCALLAHNVYYNTQQTTEDYQPVEQCRVVPGAEDPQQNLPHYNRHRPRPQHRQHQHRPHPQHRGIYKTPDQREVEDKQFTRREEDKFYGNETGMTQIVSPHAQTQAEELGLDELFIAPGYESRFIVPPTRKTQPADPLEGIDLTLTAEAVRPAITQLIKDYSNSLISYYKTDSRSIQDYCVDLKVKDETPIFQSCFPASQSATTQMDGLVQELISSNVLVPCAEATFVSRAFLVIYNAQSKLAKAKSDSRGKLLACGDYAPDTLDDEDVTYEDEFRMRLVTDLRAVNERIIMTHHPGSIMSTASLIHRLGQVRGEFKKDAPSPIVYCLIDIRKWFYSIPVSNRSMKYLAIQTYARGLLAFRVMPLGILSAPSTSTHLLGRAISHHIHPFLLTHLDDMLLVSTEDRAPSILRDLFECLDHLGILIEASKLKLCVSKLQYLGVEIDGDQVRILPERYETIMRLPMPTTRRDMQKLMGTFAFVAQFVDSLAIITSCLTPLMSEKRPFKLLEIHHRALKLLFKQFSESGSLFLLSANAPVVVFCDASYLGSGAVFTQQYGDGKMAVIKYYSYRFSSQLACSLPSSYKELHCIRKTVEKNSYIFSGPIRSTIVNDFRVLADLCNKDVAEKNSKLFRWVHFLTSLPINMQLVWSSNKHKLIQVADFLSRVEFNYSTSGGGVGKMHDSFKYYCRYSSSFERDKAEGRQHSEFPNQWREPNYVISMREFSDYVTKLVGEDKLMPYSKRFPEAEREPLPKSKPIHALPQFAQPKKKQRAHTAALPPEPLPPPIAIVQSHEPLLYAPPHSVCDESLTPEGDYGGGATYGGEETLELIVNAIELTQNPFSVSSDLPGPLDAFVCALDSDLTYENFNVSTQQIITMQQTVYAEILSELDKPNPRKLVSKKYVLLNNLLLSYWPLKHRQTRRPRILLDKILGINVLATQHLLFHAPFRSLVRLFNSTYYCKDVTLYAVAVIEGCVPCCLVNNPRRISSPAGVITRNRFPLTSFAIDHLIMPPGSIGNKTTKYLLNIVCLESHYMLAQPVADLSSRAAILAMSNLLLLAPFCSRLLSDNGSQLIICKDFQRFLQLHSIKGMRVLSYSSAANGIVEASNAVLRKAIQKCMLAMKCSSWVEVLPYALLLVNQSIRTYMPGTPHEKKCSPAQLVFGIPDNDAFQHIKERNEPLHTSLLQARDELQENLHQYHEGRRAALAQADAAHVDDMKPGTLVFVKNLPPTKMHFAWRNDVFRILARNNRKITVFGLFRNHSPFNVNVKYCKPFKSSHLLDLINTPLRAKYMKFIGPDSADPKLPSLMRTLRKKRLLPPPAVRAPRLPSVVPGPSTSSGSSSSTSDSDDDQPHNQAGLAVPTPVLPPKPQLPTGAAPPGFAYLLPGAPPLPRSQPPRPLAPQTPLAPASLPAPHSPALSPGASHQSAASYNSTGDNEFANFHGFSPNPAPRTPVNYDTSGNSHSHLLRTDSPPSPPSAPPSPLAAPPPRWKASTPRSPWRPSPFKLRGRDLSDLTLGATSSSEPSSPVQRAPKSNKIMTAFLRNRARLVQLMKNNAPAVHSSDDSPDTPPLPQIPPLRRGTRVRTVPKRYDDFVVAPNRGRKKK